MLNLREKKILFWTFVSTWKLMKSKIRFDKRGPTNDVGLTCGGCRSFLNCLFKRFFYFLNYPKLK